MRDSRASAKSKDALKSGGASTARANAVLNAVTKNLKDRQRK
jgi:hypothetical protein